MMRDAQWYREMLGQRREQGGYNTNSFPKGTHSPDGKLFRRSIWTFNKRRQRRQLRQQIRLWVFSSFPGRAI